MEPLLDDPLGSSALPTGSARKALDAALEAAHLDADALEAARIAAGAPPSVPSWVPATSRHAEGAVRPPAPPVPPAATPAAAPAAPAPPAAKPRRAAHAAPVEPEPADEYLDDPLEEEYELDDDYADEEYADEDEHEAEEFADESLAAAAPATSVLPAAAPSSVPVLRSVSLHRVRAGKGPIAVSVGSGLLGTVGLLLGLVIAAVNLAKWPTAGTCLTYASAHHGATGFGCGGGSKNLAVVLPPVAALLLTVGALAGVWIPEHQTRRRGVLLLVWLAVLIIAAGAEVVVYSKLPA